MRSGYFKVDYWRDRELFPFFFDRLAIALVAGLVVALPWVVPRYWLHLANLTGIAVVGALGLNLLMGYTGQISLGHAAFLAVGAYSAAILLKYFPFIPFPLVILAAGLVASIVGIAAAVPAFRLKGMYLALSTLALHQVVLFVILKAKSITNGAIGLHVPPPSLIWFRLDTPREFYWLILAVTVVGLICAKNLLRTKTGRAFTAIRDWDLAAEAVGVCLWKFKTLSFMVSSFYAGMAGALYAYYIGFINPEDFTLLVSVSYIAMVIVGGMGALAGSVLGAVFITFLPESANFLSHSLGGIIPAISSAAVRPYLEMLIFGLVIVLFLIFEPDGLFGRWKTVRNYFVMWPFRY